MMESNKNTDIIDVSQSLLEELSALFMNKKYSDFIFIVGNQRIFAHKFILCLRCEYFRLMFASGLREAIDNEMIVKETSLSAFKDVLYFMYCGKVHLKNKKINDIIDILFLGHRYEMHQLVEVITDYLYLIVNEDNVFEIHGTASLFNFTELVKRCQEFVLLNGYKLLTNDCLMCLNAKTLIQLFSSDDFCAEEIDIFNTVIKYMESNPDYSQDVCEKLISTVRLPLISWNDLIAYVWPSGLFGKEELLSAIDRRAEAADNYQNYRKCVQPITNLKSISNFVLEKSVLHCRKYEQNLSIILRIPGSFTIEFDSIRFINYIELDFGNCDKTGYSYYIDVSANDQTKRIVDYTDYRCHSTQYIYFGKTAAKSLRIYCCDCRSGGTNFILNGFKCMIKEIPTHLYNSSKNKTDLDYSTQNINKSYSPLYGPRLDMSSKAKSSTNKLSIKY